MFLSMEEVRIPEEEKLSIAYIKFLVHIGILPYSTHVTALCVTFLR